jgi:hypothetical protein
MKLIYGEGMSFSIPVDRVKWFLSNRQAFAYDKDNPNTGHRYLVPPRKGEATEEPSEAPRNDGGKQDDGKKDDDSDVEEKQED